MITKSTHHVQRQPGTPSFKAATFRATTFRAAAFRSAALLAAAITLSSCDGEFGKAPVPRTGSWIMVGTVDLSTETAWSLTESVGKPVQLISAPLSDMPSGSEGGTTLLRANVFQDRAVKSYVGELPRSAAMQGFLTPYVSPLMGGGDDAQSCVQGEVSLPVGLELTATRLALGTGPAETKDAQLSGVWNAPSTGTSPVPKDPKTSARFLLYVPEAAEVTDAATCTDNGGIKINKTLRWSLQEGWNLIDVLSTAVSPTEQTQAWTRVATTTTLPLNLIATGSVSRVP